MLTYPVDALIDNSATDFDLYLEVGSALTLYAKAPYKWTKDELQRLLNDGHRVLYYFTADRTKVEAYRRVHQTVRIDTTSAPRERIANLTQAASELTKILYEYPLTAASAGMVGSVAKAMVDCVEEDRSCITALGLLANHDEYTYYHSARVAAYSLAIAMHLSQRDPTMLREMAVGALLHDVGKSKVDLSILNKRGALTKEEWQQMRQHPVFGDEVVSGSLLSLMPREIILHHHERFDGTGYPHNLSERELLEEVKIAAFADVFDALTTNRPYQVSRSRYEALDFIRHKLLKVVHRDSFQAMVELLGGEADAPKKAGSD
jgi:HD-GYP domain-containing protein (c-di-GMP phosphodiesterase class II)